MLVNNAIDKADLCTVVALNASLPRCCCCCCYCSWSCLFVLGLRSPCSFVLRDRLWNGLPCDIGPLSVCPVCNSGVLWPNGWMDQDETLYEGRPRPWPHCIRWRPNSPSPKGHSSPIFGPCLLWPSGLMDQDATWYEGRPRPRPYCVTWGRSSPKKRAQPPIFSPCLLWLNCCPSQLLLSTSSVWRLYRRDSKYTIQVAQLSQRDRATP